MELGTTLNTTAGVGAQKAAPNYFFTSSTTAPRTCS